jgi:lysozyme family protein
MRANRDKSIDLTFDDEKGYVYRKTDKGGPTNMGITLTTLRRVSDPGATIEDLKRLTRAEAHEIYAKEYWNPIRGDELPSGLDYTVFDSCVTSGQNRAIKILQKALNKLGATVLVDGNIGTETMDAIKTTSTRELIQAYCDERVKFMKGISGPQGWASNGRGWNIRVTGVDLKGQWKKQLGVVGNALLMAGNSIQAPVSTEMPKDIPASELAPKATDSNTALTTILKKPEGYGTLATAATGLVTAASANSILSYALAAIMVIGAIIVLVKFTKRVREGAA